MAGLARAEQMTSDAAREFLQSYGAWIGFVAFIVLMRLIGTLGNRVWKHDHESSSDEEDGAKEEMRSSTRKR